MQTSSHFGVGAKLTGAIAIITLVTLALILSSVVFLAKQKDDSTVVNIAGRQRALSQKMTKEALTVGMGVDVNQNRNDLKATHDLFDRSLKGLISGSKELHLPATTSPEILTQLRKIENLWNSFSPQIQVMLNPAANESAQKQAIDTILKTNNALLQESNTATTLFENTAQRKINTLIIILYAGGLIAIITTIIIGLIISRRIVKPIRMVVDMVAGMEKGQLDKRLNLARKDEIGMLATAMDNFAASLQNEILGAFENLAKGNLTFEASGLIKEPLSKANAALGDLMIQMQTAGEQIAAGAGQVADASSALSQGATESASSLEQISASLHQLAAQTTTNAENANQANSLSAEARNAAQQGNQQMKAMVTAMDEINTAGQSISKIIKVIDEIAFQTNLLALNAAVEAARAGQHGKGFAVVAEEVRNLAARSAKAARETSELIEGSVQKTANGTAIANQTSEALANIVTGIGKVSDLISEIASASSEQAQGVNEISQGVSQIDQVTQQNTASAEQSAAASEELSGQAEQMREMLQQFTVKASPGRHSNVRPAPPKPAAKPSSKPTKTTDHRGSSHNDSWGDSPAQPRLAAKKQIALDDDEFGKF